MPARTFLARRRLAIGLISAVVVITALYINEAIVPKLVEQTTAFRLQRLQLEQDAMLGSAIRAIGVNGVPQVRSECGGSTQTHWHVSSDCRAYAYYEYHPAQPLPSNLRDMYLKNAQTLDALLLKNGWVVNRPGDKITSIAGIIPTHPLADGVGEQMSYHKVIGHTTCNFSVSFGGPTDGVSPGVVSVTGYSCSEQLSYFMPHLFTKDRNPGYGG
jgi:hypothetical protein